MFAGRLESALFDISDQSSWLLWILLGLGTVVLSIALATLLVWSIGNHRKARWQASIQRWEPLVLEFICCKEEERSPIVDQIRHQIGPGQMGAFSEFILGYLEELRGKDAELLSHLLESLGLAEFGMRGIRSRSPWNRARAAQLLGSLRSPNAVPALIRATDDPSSLVSYAASAALLQIGGQQGLSAVATALGKRSDWNPSQIKEILLQGGSGLGEDLVELLEFCRTTDEKTKIFVELLGILRYYPAGTMLLGYLRSTRSLELRISLVRALGRLEFEDAFPDMMECLADSNWVVRSQAALALGRIGNPGAIPRLRSALEDGSYWVRYNATLSLSALGGEGQAVLQALADSEGSESLLAQEVLLETVAP